MLDNRDNVVAKKTPRHGYYDWQPGDLIIERPDQSEVERSKSVDDVANLFRRLLTNLTHEAFNGRIQAGPMSSQMDNLLSELGRDAYLEGLRDGGVEAPEAELDREDEGTISDWIKGQLAHVGGYVTDAIAVSADNTPERRDPILQRQELWISSLRTIGAMGRMSAERNKMGTWRYGDTEHCHACLSLHGKRHRVKWFLDRNYIPRQPGSETLDCKGYKCQCGIYADDGEQLV